jgi:glucuronoarabinoxylan endo-1,4-beta-xylanase
MKKAVHLLILSAAAVVMLENRICRAQSTVTASVDPGETHQIMEGFGASLYYYSNWLIAHPKKQDIYYDIYDGLGLDILRLGNTYGYGSANIADASEFVSMAASVLGHPVRVMLSSWSPPAALKSTGSTLNGGTLVKKNGQYDYEGYAQYWADALTAYAAAGIRPDYVSVQNEPDWTASWETCEFSGTETADRAGYDRALDAVFKKLQGSASRPKMLAPEAKGIGDGRFADYAKYYDHAQVYGYAHHLYNGGDGGNPDSYIGNMQAVAAAYSDKPRFQTEYSSENADWLNTAWLMHNSLVYEEVSAYLYWGLIWGDLTSAELVLLENPWTRSQWTTPMGYVLTQRYWAFRQYSKFIEPGWKRVTATAGGSQVKVSAFINPNADSLTVVVINKGAADFKLVLKLGDFQPAGGLVVRTSESEPGDENSYDAGAAIVLPARSITTWALQGSMVSGVDKTESPCSFTMEQNHPNPFNPSTTIRFSLSKKSETVLTVFDLRGQAVLQKRFGALDQGAHSYVLDAKGFPSGVYCYRIETGDGGGMTRKFIVAR